MSFTPLSYRTDLRELEVGLLIERLPHDRQRIAGRDRLQEQLIRLYVMSVLSPPTKESPELTDKAHLLHSHTMAVLRNVSATPPTDALRLALKMNRSTSGRTMFGANFVTVRSSGFHGVPPDPLTSIRTATAPLLWACSHNGCRQSSLDQLTL